MSFISDEMPPISNTEEEFKVANECRGSRNTGGKKVFPYLHVQILFKEKND